mmetsp:Transcript_60614/g.124758  ORF Transcript_60614/g.124758 Transcript_60614/m.124758 type:complete len:359 (+) Transcript_60614:390-1466(+)
MDHERGGSHARDGPQHRQSHLPSRFAFHLPGGARQRQPRQPVAIHSQHHIALPHLLRQGGWAPTDNLRHYYHVGAAQPRVSFQHDQPQRLHQHLPEVHSRARSCGVWCRRSSPRWPPHAFEGHHFKLSTAARTARRRGKPGGGQQRRGRGMRRGRGCIRRWRCAASSARQHLPLHAGMRHGCRVAALGACCRCWLGGGRAVLTCFRDRVGKRRRGARLPWCDLHLPRRPPKLVCAADELRRLWSSRPGAWRACLQRGTCSRPQALSSKIGAEASPGGGGRLQTDGQGGGRRVALPVIRPASLGCNPGLHRDRGGWAVSQPSLGRHPLLQWSLPTPAWPLTCICWRCCIDAVSAHISVR